MEHGFIGIKKNIGSIGNAYISIECVKLTFEDTLVMQIDE